MDDIDWVTDILWVADAENGDADVASCMKSEFWVICCSDRPAGS